MNEYDQILKGGSLKSLVRPLFEVGADVLLRRESGEALVEAQEIRGAALKDADEIREQARQDGLERGLSQVAEVLAETHRQRIANGRRAAAEVVELAMATAKKLIGRALERDPSVIAELVEQALLEIAEARTVVIWVDPASAAQLAAYMERLATRAGLPSISIEADDDLIPGDCVIETDLGRIDARLQIQFERIARALLPEEQR